MATGGNSGGSPFSGGWASMLGMNDSRVLKRYFYILGPVIVLGTAVQWYREKTEIPESEKLKIEDRRLAKEQEEKRQQLYATNPNAKAVIEEARKRANM